MKCFFDKAGCNYSLLPHYHHIVPAALCGPELAWNMIPVCPNHHAIIHSMFSQTKIEEMIKEEYQETYEDLFDFFENEEKALAAIVPWYDCMNEHSGRARGKKYERFEHDYCIDPVRRTASFIMMEIQEHFSNQNIELPYHAALKEPKYELVYYEGAYSPLR